MNKKFVLYIIGILLLTTLVSAGFRTLFNPWTSRLDFVRDNNFSDDKMYLGETNVKNNLTVQGYVLIKESFSNMSMPNITFTNVSDNVIYAMNATDILTNTFKVYAFNGSVLQHVLEGNTANGNVNWSLDANTGKWYLAKTTWNRQNITLDFDRFYMPVNLSAGDLYVDKNITLGQRILFALGAYLENLRSGWLDTNASVNAANINASGYLNASSANILGDVAISGDLSIGRNTSSGWFNGRFNWTSISGFLSFNGASLGFVSSLFNLTYDERYIQTDNESLLNVNSSNNWDAIDTINTSQMENNGGKLNILATWFSTMFDNFFGLKTTDNLAQGTVNFYDNKSWNESMARNIMDAKDLIINTSATSYADGKFLPLSGGNMTGDINISSYNLTGVHCIVWENKATDCAGV